MHTAHSNTQYKNESSTVLGRLLQWSLMVLVLTMVLSGIVRLNIDVEILLVLQWLVNV